MEAWLSLNNSYVFIAYEPVKAEGDDGVDAEPTGVVNRLFLCCQSAVAGYGVVISAVTRAANS